MVQRFYKYINGRFVLFYTEKIGLITYEDGSLGKLLWLFAQGKESDKGRHFNNIQKLIA